MPPRDTSAAGRREQRRKARLSLPAQARSAQLVTTMGPFRQLQEVNNMKVRPSVKPMCEKCKIIKRKGKVMVICENPKHKQRQG